MVKIFVCQQVKEAKVKDLKKLLMIKKLNLWMEVRKVNNKLNKINKSNK